jgi:hypothetical protein
MLISAIAIHNERAYQCVTVLVLSKLQKRKANDMLTTIKNHLPIIGGLLMLTIAATAANAAAGDVGCCKVCCHGAQCVMTHHAAHDCVGTPPCK